MPAHIGSPAPAFKIKTIYSVRHLAFFIRLLSDAGAIAFNNQTTLMTKVANIFTTEKKEQISHKSLRDRYYNIDPTTKDAVKKLLLKMLDLLLEY